MYLFVADVLKHKTILNTKNKSLEMCPNRFFTLKRMPKDDSKRHSMLGELQKKIASLSISQGNDHTFSLAHARFKQVISELEEILTNCVVGAVELNVSFHLQC